MEAQPKRVMNLRKLKNASLQELRVRTSQRVAAFRERQGWSTLVKLPTDDALRKLLDPERVDSQSSLLKHFRSRSEPVFFPSFQRPEQTVEEFAARRPDGRQIIIEVADRICNGDFDLLGLRKLSFEEPIDWHLEPTTGKRIPLVHWSKLDYLDVNVAGDKKVIWELNRHQYFIKLGQAYWLSGDERYAKVFVQHLDSWMDENPPKLGINWASSLEIAFRSISWLWAFYYFKNSSSLSDATFQRAVKFLYLNARHLESYLSTYFSPNTHLTGEALGLFYMGILLPEFKEAERWCSIGSSILLEQLPLHVKEDGVYFEQSSYYHRYTTDFYTHFLILSRANNLILPDNVGESLTALLEHLMFITRPDGSTPLFGDDDGGRLLMFDDRAADDFRPALATGAGLFSRGDFKFVASDATEELLWLLGVEGVRQFDALPASEPSQLSQPFYQGGYFVMRDGWHKEANYLLFDCGPHGTMNCGHAHADALSIDLAANGRTTLVDPGTFTYTGSEQARDWFRSSQAHNTLIVDNKPSSTTNGPFSWRSVASCQVTNWITHETFDFVSGQHDGYMRLPDPVAHSRSILFLKDNYWVVRDSLRCKGLHKAELRFHFVSLAKPELHVVNEQGFVREIDTGFEIHSFAQGGGTWTPEDGWVSKCYGQRDPAPVYVFSVQLEGDGDVITFLLPPKGSRSRVCEINVEGGRGFTITGENSTDIIMVRRDGHLASSDLDSDFEWVCARFSTEEGMKELLALKGTRFSIEGETILKNSNFVTLLTASRRGDEFLITADGNLLPDRLPAWPIEAAFSRLKRLSEIAY